VVNCKKAIEACEKALNERICKVSSLQYAWSLCNLGSVYMTLAEAENPANNYGKAIDTFNQSLIIGKFRLLPKKFAKIKNQLGQIYHNLFKTSSKVSDYRNALKEYKQALNTYVKLRDQKNIDLLNASLRDLSELRKNSGINKNKNPSL
jgi:tetratricopeptide (TPR) repeat protein